MVVHVINQCGARRRIEQQVIGFLPRKVDLDLLSRLHGGGVLDNHRKQGLGSFNKQSVEVGRADDGEPRRGRSPLSS